MKIVPVPFPLSIEVDVEDEVLLELELVDVLVEGRDKTVVDLQSCLEILSSQKTFM